MRRFDRFAIGVDQGSIMLFSDFQHGGEMWTGSGPRELRQAVAFSGGFHGVPVVQATLSLLDIDQRTNQRVDLSTTEVTSKGFTLVFRTWGDTRVARVRADWLAIGELANEDDWQVD